ncbi:MAG: hypothetical protein OYG32_09385 [Rhodospirillaceae bacterium]|nr:hypothetical protein [Rhodospirillaceae bacterium]
MRRDWRGSQYEAAEPSDLHGLAPENVCKTPPDSRADAVFKASIGALGLLENLVVCADEPGETGGERYAVVACGTNVIHDPSRRSKD